MMIRKFIQENTVTALLCETHVFIKNGKCNSESLCELLAKKSCKLKVSDRTEAQSRL